MARWSSIGARRNPYKVVLFAVVGTPCGVPTLGVRPHFMESKLVFEPDHCPDDNQSNINQISLKGYFAVRLMNPVTVKLR